MSDEQTRARNQLADKMLAAFMECEKGEGMIPGMLDAVLSDVSLLMQALGAERQTYTPYYQPNRTEVRWVTPWQEATDE
jgi:hypothetical protein